MAEKRELISLYSVTFASSVRLGKDNYEYTSIDIQRPEHKNFTLTFDGNLVWIIDNDTRLKDEKFKSKRMSTQGLPNIRCMSPKSIPSDIKAFIVKESKVVK